MDSKENKSTPAATWRVNGEPDPHGTHYDGERAALAMGHLTDDEMANAIFMNYDANPSIGQMMAGTGFRPIVWATAAKERIRWLSRALVKATAAAPAAAPQVVADERALPLLPKPAAIKHPTDDTMGCVLFSSQQMQDYARAALAAAPVHSNSPELHGIAAAPVQAQEPVASCYQRMVAAQHECARRDGDIIRLTARITELNNELLESRAPVQPMAGEYTALRNQWAEVDKELGSKAMHIAAFDDGVNVSAPPVAVPDEVIVLLNHIEVVVDEKNWEKIDHKLWNAVTMLAAPAAQGDAVQAAQIEDGYEGGTCIADPTRLGGTVHLHYISPEHAESAFETIAEIIDAAIAAKAAS